MELKHETSRQELIYHSGNYTLWCVVWKHICLHSLKQIMSEAKQICEEENLLMIIHQKLNRFIIAIMNLKRTFLLLIKDNLLWKPKTTKKLTFWVIADEKLIKVEKQENFWIYFDLVFVFCYIGKHILSLNWNGVKWARSGSILLTFRPHRISDLSPLSYNQIRFEKSYQSIQTFSGKKFCKVLE